ncbi:MAG TPA: ABC transporter permease [Thermoanaerobaculia bacterium]|nr:ABC transporter permease [Thermoanaerobaculia bacterium]
MSAFLLRRLAASLLLLLLVLSITFLLLHLVPGDPARIQESDRMTAEQRENLRRVLGLDRPLHEQYFSWLSGAVLRGDLGTSFSQQRPVTEAIKNALPGTLLLAFAALFVEFGAALLLGVAAARRPGTAVDHSIRIGTLLLFSQPVFWLGLMAILLFSYVWPVLPAGHMRSVGAGEMGAGERLFDLLRHLLLPALVLGLTNAGATARFVRGSLLEVLSRDYIRTARAKGLSERRVVWVHGMRNALPPLVQLLALTLPALLNGSLVTEVVFSWPGLGRLTFGAILARDFPLILGTVAVSAILVISGNLAADVLHALSDPRVRDA